MPSEEQVRSILKTFGVSEQSMKLVNGDDGGITAFIKASKKTRRAIGRDTQRFPHISPALGETPAHLTSIRFIKTVSWQGVDYDVIQRFHQWIDAGGNLGQQKHDRFRAVNRATGAIHTAGAVANGPAPRDERSIVQLRALQFTIGLQCTEQQRPSVMSKAVMNRFNIGER